MKKILTICTMLAVLCCLVAYASTAKTVTPNRNAQDVTKANANPLLAPEAAKVVVAEEVTNVSTKADGSPLDTRVILGNGQATQFPSDAPAYVEEAEKVVTEVDEATEEIWNRYLETGEINAYEKALIYDRILAEEANRPTDPLDDTGGTLCGGFTFEDNINGGMCAFDWIELCGTDAIVLATTDDSEANITLGSAFPFYGVSSALVRVGNNGGLLLGVTTGDVTYDGSGIPLSATNTVGRLGVFQCDLNSGALIDGCSPTVTNDEVLWKDFGAYAVIEWKKIPPYALATDQYSFEAILYDDGTIKYQYNGTDWVGTNRNALSGIQIDGPLTAGVDYLLNGVPASRIPLGNRAICWTPVAPQTGRCCYVGGCAEELQADCIARTNEFSWTCGMTCATPCPEVGRCCYGTNNGTGGILCQIEPEANCIGRANELAWTAGIFDCVANPCVGPIPTGRCCYGNPAYWATYSCLANTTTSTEYNCLVRTDDLSWTAGITVCAAPDLCPVNTPPDCGTPDAAAWACADAILLSVPGDVFSTTVGAPAFSFPAGCGTSDGTGGSVWYKLVGTGNTVTLTTCDICTSFDTKLRVYTCDCDNKLCVGGNDDMSPACPSPARSNLSSFSFCTALGEEYLVEVFGFTTNSGQFKLHVTDNGVPCTGAIVCPCWDGVLVADAATSVVLNGTNVGAGDDCLVDPNGGEDFVVQVTIPSAGDWKFSLCGSDFDTRMSVGTDCCLDDVCFNDDNEACGAGSWQSECCVEALAAGIYYVTIEGYFGETGNFVLTVGSCTPPQGRCCYYTNRHNCALKSEAQCDALNGTWAFGLTCATPCETGRCCYGDMGSPTCAINYEYACITLAGNWTVGITSCIDNPCPSLAGENCDYPVHVITPGEMPYTDSGTTVGKNNDYDEVCPYGGSTSPDVAYHYTPAADENVTIDLCLSGYDTKLYLYALPDLVTPVYCNDDAVGGLCPGATGSYRSRLECVLLLADVTYCIVVDGYGGESGLYTLRMEVCEPCVPPVPLNDQCINLTNCPVVIPGVPTVLTGNDCGALANDCITGVAIVWECFTIEACADVTLAFCGSEGSGAMYNNIFGSCTCLPAYLYSGYDATWSLCADGMGTIWWNGLAAGTYYVPIHPSLGPNYTMTITAVPCPVGRCCYGDDPFNPLCAEETQPACLARTNEFSWAAGITCAVDCPEPYQCNCATQPNTHCIDPEPNFFFDDLLPYYFIGINVPIEYHITDLNVCLDITHTWDSDVQIILVSPMGTQVNLSLNHGGSDDNYTCTTFDDEAFATIASGAAPFFGEYKPDSPLSAVDFENAYGVWGLYLIDLVGGDDGTLNWACLNFEYDVILPVELTSFDAIAGDRAVTLNWETASETSNDYYRILRDGTSVGEVDANGSATGGTYTYTDNGLANGTSYNYSVVSVSISGDIEEVFAISATPSFSAATITEYALHQNFPNPFNPETKITFDLVDAGFVNLTIYNLLGQQVANLVNTSMGAGRHIVSFEATNLPSGLYLYRMEANGFSAQKKMVLMK